MSHLNLSQSRKSRKTQRTQKKPVVIAMIQALFFSLFLIIAMSFYATPAKAAIIFGNPTGTVTLSFIYDYQCDHCHRMFPSIQKLIDQDQDLRIKLFPIAVLNRNSLIEASAAIAATKYAGKFQELTTLLMYQPPLQTPQIQQALQRLHLNSRAYLLSMHEPWVADQLMESMTILQHLNTKKIPVCIIEKTNEDKNNRVVLIGEQSYSQLSGDIDHVRHD